MTHRHPRFEFGAFCAAVLVLATAVSCGGGSASGTAATAESTVAPDFELTAIDGSSYRLAESAGKVRLIDFWATWCAPCREEVPMFNELHAEYGDDGLEIVAIADAEETLELVRGFVEEHGIVYTNLLGSDTVATDYKVYGLPTAYLLDREGRIVEQFFGAKPRKVLEAKIRNLLELPPET